MGSRPAPILMGACVFSLSVSTIIACAWPDTYPDEVHTEGMFVAGDAHGLPFYIWTYCVAWWLVQDICKVGVWKKMREHNFLGVNNTGAVVFGPSSLRKIKQMKEELADDGMGGRRSSLGRASLEERRPSLASYGSSSQLHKLEEDVDSMI